MKHFVFLEFTNPILRKFLKDLSSSISQKKVSTSMHITIRGPYSELPKSDILEPLVEKLQGFGLVIGGTGIFKTPKCYVVYLKVASPIFKDIWWKPDFNDEGINPHITIYETNSLTNAKLVEKFIKSERIEIFTLSFILTTYTSKQSELFEETKSPEELKKLASLEKMKIKTGILDRAKILALSLE